jgi:quinoprotein glucose dehydrogenase
MWAVMLALLLASKVSIVRSQGGAPANGEWPTYGGDLGSTKYSPLSQIDRGNFNRLKAVWRWRSADGFLSMTTPHGGEWSADSEVVFAELNRQDPKRWRDGAPPTVSNFKATPIMIGGVLYLNTPASIGAAIDARTGRTIWTYNPKSYEEGTTSMTARWNQRGVAYWSDGTDARIFWGTGNGYLVCVEAKTGRPCPGFGDRGRVDLMADIPRAKRGERDWNNQLLYSVQSPPLVAGNVVVTPMSIPSFNKLKEMPPGWMRGFDVRTGKTLWTFHTIPLAGEYGNDTWQDESWRHTGKVGVWTMMSADLDLGYVYLPLNTPAPDYYGGHRPGDNLFAESLLCLDLRTGKRVWHFQTVHHGLWDYDLPAAPNLIDVTVNGQRVKAVAQVTKQGFTFVFDRTTGKPIWPIEERPVPTDTNLVGEKLAATQPFPTKPAPFDYQGVTVDDLADFTPEIRQMAIEAVKPFRLGPLFTPQSMDGTLQRPGTNGGANWSGAAVDPETGILYVPSRNSITVRQFRIPDPKEDATLRYIEVFGRGSRQPQMPRGLPLLKPPYSRMTAIDLNSGDHVWMKPMGNGDRFRRNPLLASLNLPPLGGDSAAGGPLVTKTLLIFALTAGGTDDGPRLAAFDKRTGEEVGSIDLPAAAIGTPMTYMVDGRQFIALTVGGRPVPELIALSLPD